MRTNSASESGAFNPRIFAAFVLISISGWLAVFSFAATPATGTLSEATPLLTYEAGPFSSSNPTPVLLVDSGPECGTANPCDNYALTATITSTYIAAHPNASIKVTASWTDTGSGQADYDLYIYKVPNPKCSPDNCFNTNGSQSASYQSATGANPEVANIFPLVDGTQKYTVKIVPYTSTREVVKVKIELQAGAAGSGVTPPPFGGGDSTAPGKPRYQNFFPPVGSSAESSDGEFNIGFNPKTGRIMAMNIGPIWRLTPPEIAAPPFRPVALPECCEALWQDRSNASTNTGLDPIMWTDQKTGRTFASNTTAGGNGAYGFTDNDGDLWVPVGAAPPDGADHQTIGTGPYPTSLAALVNPLLNQGQFVLYCSQTLVGSLCQRSDDLGSIYGPGMPATGPGTSSSKGCGGLHGHVHVAPNGTAWLPDKSCGSRQGGGVNSDGNLTPWSEFVVAGNNDANGGAPFVTVPQADGADPSIGLDADSRAYYAYVNNEAGGTEGHAHVAISEDNGKTWIRDVDIGLPQNIKNAVHIEAVGGSSGRAAVGFIGTNLAGPNYEESDFQGRWYAFIATTYDGGRTWTTVNATPNDPVQSKTGVWQRGGSHDDRNTLDFNEITVDAKGRPLYGYSDGCVSAGCIDGSKGNDFTAHMRVARQTGGKSIFASNDANTDTTTAILPKAPCLSGTRSPTVSLLTWKAPDNGGAVIVNYQIFRSNAAGTEILIGESGGPSTTYRDLNPPADKDLFYRVQAINAVGTGPLSNEIDLVVVQPPPVQNVCIAPGLTLLTDKAGDTSAALGIVQTPAPPGSDLLSFQLAQPLQPDGVLRLVFTINTDANPSGTEGPGYSAYVAMKIAGPDPAIPNDTATVHYRSVRLTYKPSPTFESYTPSPNNSGTVDGRFVKAGSTKPAEATSSYDGPKGKITIIVKASDLGLAPGGKIDGFVSGTSQTTDPLAVGVAATTLYDQMPDSLAFSSSFTLGDNVTCSSSTGLPQVLPSLAQLLNISSRIGVRTGDDVAFAGVIITGTEPKKVVLRGIGPSINANGTLQDPTLELFDSNNVSIGANDNWKDSPQRSEIEGDNLAPKNDLESAILATLSANTRYSVILRGKDGGTGIGVVEAYDVNLTSSSLLANISTRGFVDTGDKALFGGFIVGPNDATGTTVVARAIGPSLKDAGVPGALQDPTIELFNGNGDRLAFNDNWKDTQQTDIEKTGLAPKDDRESAILSRLGPGLYSAIVRGKDNGTGVGLVEFYNVR